MLRIDSGEESDSDRASFYSFNTQISDKSSKLNKFDSFQSIYSVDSKNDSSQHLEHICQKDSAKFGLEKSCEQLGESSESYLHKNLNVKNTVNVIIMSSSSGATPKSELSKSDLKDSGKKKKGIRISFKRKKSSKKEKSGVSGTDSDFSSSNPITPQSTPQVTPHGTLEKNATPWKSEESSGINNVGQENQVSEKIKSEKKFGPILMFKREPKKLKAIAPPVVPLSHESATAHEPVQKQSDDENCKTLTMSPSTSDAVEPESVTDRVNISQHNFSLISNLSDTEEELGPIDDMPPKLFKISASDVEKVSPMYVISEDEKGMDIAEGRFNPEKYREVEENVSKDTVLRKNVLISEFTTDEIFIDDEETDSKIEALVNEVKSIAQEIVEVELIEKANLTQSHISNEESSIDKVTVRKKISNEISNESGNLSISKPIYQSLTEPIPFTNKKIGRSSLNRKLNNSYPSFSSKIFISIEEPKSENSNLKGEPVSRDSLVQNIDKLTKCPRPLPFQRYAPFGTVVRSKLLTSMSLSRSFSIDTEDEGFSIPRKSTSYSNTNICAEVYNTERSSNVETSEQLSDSWAVSSSDKKEHLYKILVIGELGTGKTSIIKRYVHQFFCQHYRATIGVDFALKVLNWDENTVIRLQLWDIAGQERFGNMTRVYYKQAVGAFVVFDVSNAKTFDAVTKWKNDLDSKVTLPDGSNIPTVLLANKCDQPKEGLVSSPSKMDEYCREKNFAGWFETSAKEDVNIDEATKFLITKILNNEEEGLMIDESFDKEKFSIEGNHEVEEAERKKCSC